jgi:hypothetical protein
MSESRVGTTVSSSGACANRRHGPGIPVLWPRTIMNRPSDSSTNAAPVTASARTAGRRHSQPTATIINTARPQP